MIVHVQSAFAQDSLRTVQLDDVIVYATRANEKTPTTVSFFSKKEIAKRNLGQDLPILLNFTPSIVSTSDAGTGIGYTGMRIRGSDATRINVTINGIPLNDPESHGVFWVNMPDFSSSLNSIQIQRGVGTSSNGAGAFGATVNLQTSNVPTEPFIQSDNSFGSFNSWKTNLVYNTGLIDDTYNFEARLSKISSDGYVDRSAADLRSYYLSGGRFAKKTMIKTVIFGGQEITSQAWYGTPEARLTGDPDAIRRLIDFSGEYANQEQIVNLQNSDRRFNYYLYDNEVDDYRQDHYQLHIGHTFSGNLNYSGALHYTRGRGFFEQFGRNDDLSAYNLPNVVVGSETITSSDMIRRRWLDNHFYGITHALNFNRGSWDVTLGGAYNRYIGDHFGEIVWAQFAGNVNIRDRYYNGEAEKTDFNTFLKTNYQLTTGLNLFGDLQVRAVSYKTSGTDSDVNAYDVDTDLAFFNPKFGLTYSLNGSTNMYASYAVGNREPVRSDFIDANPGTSPTHETLQNTEAGIRSKGLKFSYEANYYIMKYKNQLVLTGAVNDVGGAIRINVPKSFRMGVELNGAYQLTENLIWSANVTLSQNKIREFTEIVSASFGEIRHRDSDISFSPHIIGSSSLSLTPLKIFTVELLTKYVGKQFLDNTSNDSRAIDAYLTNDMLLTCDFSWGGIQNIGLSLLITNVLNKEYSSNGYTWGYYFINDTGSEELYQQNNYYPQAKINFMAGLSVRF